MVSGLSSANGVESRSLNISAAPWWNRGVTPADSKVAAISSISPIHRPALAGSPGIPDSMAESAPPWLDASSSMSSSYSPSDSAAVSIATRSAFVPFVMDA